MKISCQSCQAKYTIADEKVLGKVVKIRCKKCGATIVINGAEGHQAVAQEEASAAGEMLDYGSAGDQWTVNVAEGDQRTMTTQELVAEYRAGTVTFETYCWKDGMDGWLPVRDIDQLHAALATPSTHPASAGSDFAPVVPVAAAAPLFGGAASNNANLFGGGGGGGGESAPAARRERSRNAGADLFGGVAQAGSENDRMAAVVKDEPKLTGQRNESSVLFSLSSLTKEGEKGNDTGGNGGGGSKTTAQGDGSGLIDIRALSSSTKNDRPKSSGVDDIMNLGGGGAFGAALAAPILAPPAMDPAVAASYEASQGANKGGNKGIIFAIVGGVAFLTVAVVLAIVFTRPPPPAEAAAGKGNAGAATGPSAIAALDTTPKEAPTGAAAPSAADTTAKEPGAGTVGAAPKGAVAAAGGAAVKPKSEPGGAAAPAAPAAPAAAPAAPASTKPKSMDQAMCEATGTCGNGAAAAPAAASGAAFDRGAAAASLGGVNVASCKKPDGPSGSGHVTVTFAPNGSVSSAVVDGGPFPGTPVGGCIAGKYRGAHVPAFGGSPVKVGKSFSL